MNTLTVASATALVELLVKAIEFAQAHHRDTVDLEQLSNLDDAARAELVEAIAQAKPSR